MSKNVEELIKRRAELGAELEKTTAKLTEKRAALAGAVLAGGDVDKLQAEIARLTGRISALDAGKEAGEIELRTQQAEAERAEAEREFQAAVFQVENELPELLRGLDAVMREAEKLARTGNAARGLAEGYGFYSAGSALRTGIAQLVLRESYQWLCRIELGGGFPELERAGLPHYQPGYINR